MRGFALPALLSTVALASPLTPENDHCEQKIVYEYVYETASFNSAPAAAPGPVVLSPTVPSNINKYSLQHVTPTIGSPTSLYFESRQNNQVGYSAVSKASFNAPAVVIDHCGYAKTVYSNGQLVISFSYSAAYTAAKTQWGGLDKLYIMTHTPGCGNYAKGEHCFFSATKFSYDEATKTITCSGESKPATDCVDGYEVDFGHGDQGGHYGAGNGAGNGTGNGNPSFGNGTMGNGNDTYATNLTSVCNAPVDNKYNLPTACLGPYFDGDIDDRIGHQNGNQSSWAPKVPGSIHAIDSDDLLDNVNAPLKKRGPIDFISNTVVRPAVAKAKQLGTAVKHVVNNKIVPAIDKFTTFNTGARTFEFSAPREHKVKVAAPWPNARLLYKGIPQESKTAGKKVGTVKGKKVEAGAGLETALNIYCVDCGIKGKMKYSGSVKVGAGSLEYIVLDTDMDMTISMYAGLSGNISATLPGFSAEILAFPITPFLIPPFIEVGPSISVGIDMNIKIGLENANVLAGGTLTWKGTKSRMAYKNGESSGSNWTPEFKPTFNASGELSLALDFGIPVELLLGVKLLSSKKLGAGFIIEARPAIEAKASIEGSYSKTAGTPAVKTIGDDECPFIKTGLDFKFESGVAFKLSDQLKFPLAKFHKPYAKTIHKGCISKNATGLSFKGEFLPKKEPEKKGTRDIQARQMSNNTISSNDTLWYLDATQLTNTTLEASASDPVEAFTLPAIASIAYNDTEGIEYVSLYDASSEFLLTTCGDGNLYMQLNENLTSLAAHGCGTLFAYDSETELIYADGSAQLFYFNPQEMKATGVSRLRHSAIENMPTNAEYVFFEPNAIEGDDDDLPDDPIYLAKTVDEVYYATAVCLFADPTLPAKVFLVEDVEKGVEMLKSPDIKYSIAGGDVTECFYLPLLQGNDTPDSAWNGVADNLDWEEDWVGAWDSIDELLDDESEWTDEEIDALIDSL